MRPISTEDKLYHVIPLNVADCREEKTFGDWSFNITDIYFSTHFWLKLLQDWVSYFRTKATQVLGSKITTYFIIMCIVSGVSVVIGLKLDHQNGILEAQINQNQLQGYSCRSRNQLWKRSIEESLVGVPNTPVRCLNLVNKICSLTLVFVWWYTERFRAWECEIECLWILSTILIPSSPRMYPISETV